MSEYQYYEFQTVDRTLTSPEKDQIQQLSSRVQISSTRAIFTYSYGDFRGDPHQVLAQYFDAMFYIANWGTIELLFRLPAALVDLKEIEPYCLEYFIEVSQVDKWVILKIHYDNEEGFGWIDGDEEYLDSLIELRQDILNGDYRLLYLAWLALIPLVDIDETTPEPPIPPGLQDLSPPLEAFIELFEVDEYLVQVAARVSPSLNAIPEPSLEAAIKELPRAECDQFLQRLLNGEPNLNLVLKQRLSEFTPSTQTATTPKRTIGELLQAAETERQEAKRRQRQEAEARRIQGLKDLAKREESVWEWVEILIGRGQSKPYDEAVASLVQLRELAEYQEKLPAFRAKIKDMRERYSRRTGLMRRFNQAGLKA
jgi:hypothetical protein